MQFGTVDPADIHPLVDAVLADDDFRDLYLRRAQDGTLTVLVTGWSGQTDPTG